jgi:hypothetical protein
VAVIQATIRATWRLSADEVSFGRVYLDEPDDPEVSIAFFAEPDVLVEAPRASAAWVECRAGPQAPDGGPRDLHLRCRKSELVPGLNTAVLRFTTVSPTVPDGALRVSAIATGALEAYPPLLLLLPGCESVVRFRDRRHEPAQLVRVEAPPGAGLDVRVRAEGEVSVRAPAEAASGPVELHAYDTLGQRGQALISVWIP